MSADLKLEIQIIPVSDIDGQRRLQKLIEETR